MLSRTLLMVRAGLHCSFKMSRQMLPWEFTFGWYTLVWKLTCRRASQSNMGVSQPNTGPRTHTHTHTCANTEKTARTQFSLSLFVRFYLRGSWARKTHLGWLERVVRWEVDGYEEHSSLVWAVLGSHDGGLPVEQVLPGRSSAARGRWVLLEILELLLNSLRRHGGLRSY